MPAGGESMGQVGERVMALVKGLRVEAPAASVALVAHGEVIAAFIGEGLPVFEIRDTAGMTDMLVSDAGRAAGLVEALGSHRAVLMRGHGATVVGPDIPFAVGRSIYLELGARLQKEAITLGGRCSVAELRFSRR